MHVLQITRPVVFTLLLLSLRHIDLPPPRLKNSSCLLRTREKSPLFYANLGRAGFAVDVTEHMDGKVH